MALWRRTLCDGSELLAPRVLLACDWFVKYTAGLARGLADIGCEVTLLTRDHDLEFGAEPGKMREFVAETLDGTARHLELGGRVREVSRLRDVVRLRGDVSALEAGSGARAGGAPRNDMRLAVVAGLARRRYALTVHDPARHPGDRERSAWGGAMEHALRRRAQLIFVHSRALADELMATGDVRGPIEVVPHGIGEVVMTKLPERPALLFFGRISHYKGLDTLLDAMQLVWERRPDVTLTVAGAGEVPTHESLADSRVTLRAEHLPEAAVSGLFGEATCVVLPYRQASQSGVGSEAKRHGRAIVATAVGGLPELVTPGCGRLVPRRMHRPLPARSSRWWTRLAWRRRWAAGRRPPRRRRAGAASRRRPSTPIGGTCIESLCSACDRRPGPTDQQRPEVDGGVGGSRSAIVLEIRLVGAGVVARIHRCRMQKSCR